MVKTGAGSGAKQVFHQGWGEVWWVWGGGVSILVHILYEIVPIKRKNHYQCMNMGPSELEEDIMLFQIFNLHKE